MCSQDEKYFEGKLLQLCDTVNMASAGDVNTPATVVLKDKEVQATGKYWTKSEKNQWAFGLFCGTAMLYASRTIMPMCVVTVSKEMDWDKTESPTASLLPTITVIIHALPSPQDNGDRFGQCDAHDLVLLFRNCTYRRCTMTVLVGNVHYPNTMPMLFNDLMFLFHGAYMLLLVNTVLAGLAMLGTVLSAFFWGYTMTQFLGGYLSDRIGGDVVLPIAACMWSLITFWTPQLAFLSNDKHTALYIVVLSRVMLGMCQGFHYPGMTSIISRKVHEQERSLTYSVVSTGSHVGTLLTGSFGSLLMENYGWEIPFYAIGMLGILWMLVARYFLIAQHRERYITVGAVSPLPGPATVKEHQTVPWITLLTKPAFWSLLVGHFCENNAFYILLSWLPTFFHENFPSAKGWVFNVVPWVVTIPSSVGSGWLADHMIRKGYAVTAVRKIMETIALCGTALFLVLISFTGSYHSALICMALAVSCCGFHNSGILVNPQDIAPRHAGAVFGIMNMAGAIPGFVGVYIAGHILETTKSWSAVFNQTAGVCMVGWIVFVVFGTGKQIV